MTPGHEIAIRAVGTALAGMSMAFAVYMLAYGGGKTRINGLEHLAIFAQPRGSAVGAPPAKVPTPKAANAGAAVDMATTGSFAAAERQCRARKAADRDRRCASRSRLAEDRRRAPLSRSRRQHAGRRSHRGDCRARRRLDPPRRQRRGSPRRHEGRKRGRAFHPQQNLRMIRPHHRRPASSRRARS